MPVVPPRQPGLRHLLTRAVEHRTREQQPIRLPERQHPRARVEREAEQLRALPLVHHHLPQVRREPIPQGHGAVGVERGQRPPGLQHPLHGRRRRLEREQHGVAGGLDLLAVADLGERLAEQAVMRTDRLGVGAVAELLTRGGGADDIGEHNGEDARGGGHSADYHPARGARPGHLARSSPTIAPTARVGGRRRIDVRAPIPAPIPEPRSIDSHGECSMPTSPPAHANDHAGASREDRLVVVRGMRWSDWVRHQEARGDRSAPRLAYLDGALQFMSPSRHHERLTSMIGRLVEAWAYEQGIELLPLGSWTLEDRAEDAGAEPDECYQIATEEGDRPDLAIEVVWTSGGLSKLEIYRRLRVPEVWTWRRGQLDVHVLQGGAYEERQASEAFPDLDLDLLVSLLDQPTITAARRALLAHLRSLP